MAGAHRGWGVAIAIGALASAVLGPLPALAVGAQDDVRLCPGSFSDLPLDTSRTYARTTGNGHLAVCFYGTAEDGIKLDLHWTAPDPGGAGAVCLRDTTTPYQLSSRDRAASVSWRFLPEPPYQPFGPERRKAAAASVLASIEPLAASCGGSLPTPMPTATGSTSPGPSTAPLCVEARALLEGFSQETLERAGLGDASAGTGLQADLPTLRDDMLAALDGYDADHPDATSYVTDGPPYLREVAVVNWLSAEGGAFGGTRTSLVTGQEAPLEHAIRAEVARRAGGASAPESRLSPGDVLRLALDLTGGDVNAAVLTAHNLMRFEARGIEQDAPGLGDLRDRTFMDQNLRPLRRDDNTGAWYHLFGTAYYEMTARGDWGPAITVGATGLALAAGVVSLPAALLTRGALALAGVAGVGLWRSEDRASGVRVASRVAQTFEQGVRRLKGRDPDPEEFCVNLWGAQIGAALYRGRPYRATRALRALFSSLPAPSPRTLPASGPMIAPAPEGRTVTFVGSPYAVWFDAGDQQLLVDQGRDPAQAGIEGGIDGLAVQLVPEESSWGLAYVGADDRLQRVVLEPVRDRAPLTVLRLNLATGAVLAYHGTTSRGQQVVMESVGGRSEPTVVTSDGTVWTPVRTTVTVPSTEAALAQLGYLDRATSPSPSPPSSTSGASASGSPGTSGSSGPAGDGDGPPALVLVGATALVVLSLVLAVWLLARLTPRPPAA